MILTAEEIAEIRNSAIALDEETIMRSLDSGIPPAGFKVVEVKGIKICYTIDEVANMKFEHLSVSELEQAVDPADAEQIAHDVLGEGYKRLRGLTAHQFVKVIV